MKIGERSASPSSSSHLHLRASSHKARHETGGKARASTHPRGHLRRNTRQPSCDPPAHRPPVRESQGAFAWAYFFFSKSSTRRGEGFRSSPSTWRKSASLTRAIRSLHESYVLNPGPWTLDPGPCTLHQAP